MSVQSKIWKLMKQLQTKKNTQKMKKLANSSQTKTIFIKVWEIFFKKKRKSEKALQSVCGGCSIIVVLTGAQTEKREDLELQVFATGRWWGTVVSARLLSQAVWIYIWCHSWYSPWPWGSDLTSVSRFSHISKAEITFPINFLEWNEIMKNTLMVPRTYEAPNKC